MGLRSFRNSVDSWSPYSWNFKRDYAIAVAGQYFNYPGTVSDEDVLKAVEAMEQVRDGRHRAEQRACPAHVEIAEWPRPAVLGAQDAEQQPTDHPGTSLQRPYAADQSTRCARLRRRLNERDKGAVSCGGAAVGYLVLRS